MPGFDGTGPAGLGPMTGRGQGYCVLERVKQEGAEKLVGLAGIDGRPVEVALGAVQDFRTGGMNMPGGDGTGPLGLGPMTGRATGYCAGYPVPGSMNPFVVNPPWWGPPPAAPFIGPGRSFGRVPFYGAPGCGCRPGFVRPLGGFGRGFGRGRGWRPRFGRLCW